LGIDVMNLPLRQPQQAFEIRTLPASGLAPPLERRRLQFYGLQIVVDAAAIFGSFGLAGLSYIGRPDTIYLMLPAQLILPIYVVVALQNGSYSLAALKDWRTGARRAVGALLISAVLVNFVAFFAKMNATFSRGGFAIALVIAIVAVVGIRRITGDWARRSWGPNPLNILVIDDGGPPIELRHCYQINTAHAQLAPSLDDPFFLDRLAQSLRNMDQVIVSCTPDRRGLWSKVLKAAGVHGEVLSDGLREIGALGIVHRQEIDLTSILVSTGPLGLRARATKRILDIFAALLALAIALPVLLLAALAIKLEDRGPVLFKQKRVGRRNQLFDIYKLRTMKVERADSDGNLSASRNDDRVTRIGRILRRTSIDELPQLFNVLKADMSLVGPRPHAIGSLAGDKLFWEVDQLYWQRHSLRPGLTGLAQVRGLRGATVDEIDLTSRLQADLEYINGWTVWRDFRILAATTRVLVHDRAF
jgi:exopolysaccharide biosynthesis polyprenyl glycosylphosphotransferase